MWSEFLLQCVKGDSNASSRTRGYCSYNRITMWGKLQASLSMPGYFSNKMCVEARSIKGQDIKMLFSITAALLGGGDPADQQVGLTPRQPLIRDFPCRFQSPFAMQKFLSSPDCCPGGSTGWALSSAKVCLIEKLLLIFQKMLTVYTSTISYMLLLVALQFFLFLLLFFSNISSHF